MSRSLGEIAEILKDVDFVMLNTHADEGTIAGRPMSNNRDVEYDGDSWFFVDEESRTFEEVAQNPKVTLSVQGAKGLLGKPPIFLSIEGEAEIVRDRAILESHWTSELERWWPQGPGAPGLSLIKIHAQRIHYWDGEDQGDIAV